MVDGPTQLNTVNGIAVFSGTGVNRPGRSLTLIASSGTLIPDTTERFDIVLNVASISAGSDHTCDATADRLFYCWGRGSAGQLGNGGTASTTVPDSVSGARTVSARMVSAGDAHSCGVVPGGSVYCWGNNWAGQLGNGSSNDSDVPVRVTYLPSVLAVTAGRFHTCAVSTDQQGFCWGDNGSGQLGDGTNAARSQPGPVGRGHPLCYHQRRPPAQLRDIDDRSCVLLGEQRIWSAWRRHSRREEHASGGLQ